VSGSEDVAANESGHEVNPTAASLLGFLHDGPLTGWNLVARADRTIGPFWSLTRSQVYRELALMAQHGLVEAGPAGRRDARPYAITDAGRAAFARWAAKGPDEATMRLPLLLFVVLGRHMAPGLLADVLRDQRAHQAALLAEYQKVRREVDRLRQQDPDAVDPHLVATLDFGISTARATVRWIDHLPPDLGN
jgi:DNA-binding PadR family transcriptional regulator